MRTKIKLYSTNEIIQYFILSLCTKLLKIVTKKFKSTNNFLNRLLQKDVKLISKNGNYLFDYRLNLKKYSFVLKRNSSDIDVFSQIILNEEYKSVIDVIQKYNLKITLMIDAGANIGLTSLYFKSYFPDLSIIALEPSKSTFNRLQRLISRNSLEKVTLLEKGLWKSKTRLKGSLDFGDHQDWAFTLVESNKESELTIDVVSIEDIMRSYSLKIVDFLKIDIEGGERVLFDLNNNLEWLKKVKLLAMEIHDEFDCREYIENILVQYNFELIHSGELTIGVNKSTLV